MDQTTRGYPYPECAPPLVKDASFIGQMEDLAQAIDADMNAVEALANPVLISPNTARIISVSTPTTAQQADLGAWTSTFTNDPTMYESGGVRIPVTGWYFCTSFTLVTTTDVNVTPKQLFLVNGAPANQFGDSSQTYITNTTACYQTDVLLLNAGDLVSVRVRHEAAGSPSWTHQARLGVMKLVAL